MKEECLKKKIKFIEMLFQKDAFDNDFYKFIENYIYFDIGTKTLNTGILKVKHISHILDKYSYINWLDLCEVRLHVSNNKIKYLLRIIELYSKSRRLREELPFDSQNNIKLVYISTNNQLLNSGEVELNPGTQFSYAIPAVYTSGFVNNFSECTKDLFWDRLSMGIFYDKGITIDVKNNENDDSFFYIDRKINISYVRFFIEKITSELGVKFIWLDEAMLSIYCEEIRNLMSIENIEVNNRVIFQKIIEVSSKLEFSFIGYLLFEIFHEYIIEKNIDIFTANQILRIISPNQFVLWSMRSFAVSNLRELILKMKVVVPGFNEEEFICFVVSEFTYRIFLIIGDNFENLEDAVYVSMFSKKVHHIENSDINLKTNNNFVSKEFFEGIRDVSVLTDEIEDINPYQVQIKSLKIHMAEVVDFLAKQEENIKFRLKDLIFDYFVKLAYQKIKDDMKKAMNEIFSKNQIGVVMANLQPDDRGEFLLVSCNPNQNKFVVKSFLLNEDLEISNLSEVKNLSLKSNL